MADTGERRSAGISPASRGEGGSTGATGPEPRVVVCADEQGVARAAADELVRLSKKYVADNGTFYVALSGGKTPQLLYRMLAGDEFRGQVNWGALQIFWGDERGVPPEHPESNYGMARRELLSRVGVPAENIHRMEAERADITQAASDYKQILRRCLPDNGQHVPRFDLILLGVGTDGHAASLIPSSDEWREARGCVTVVSEKSTGARRMTLTLLVLNAARHVIFLVTGAAKAAILRRVIKDRDATLPAAHVRPADGELLFMVDEAAAAELSRF